MVTSGSYISDTFLLQVGRCNVATGPQRVSGAPKPVSIDMRNEAFDEGFAGAFSLVSGCIAVPFVEPCVQLR